MPDIIQLLPDNIANQIAAGEVIQRPASVVKELLENAVDAGSTKINLIIKDAGKALVQVIDNGTGMSATDARMSFERHATSKIKSADDLFDLHTKGFRGEALASIAAIAQVELITKTANNDLGTKICIAGAAVEKQENCQANTGTNFSVKNLFYNVPARRNFLKSNPVETRHIINEFIRVALAHPDIAFSLSNNGLDMYHLNSGTLKQRIVGLLGKKFDEKIAPINEATDFLKVSGFIGKPEFSKKTRGDQYFFVNDRFIKSPYLNHAVNTAYSQLIPKDVYPFYCIFIDIDPSRIDVNIHPTKQEIKFDDEKVVYAFINAGVRHSLGKFSNMPTIDFDKQAAFNSHPVGAQKEALVAKYDGGSFINKGIQTDWSKSPKQHSGEVKNWEDLYEIARQSPSSTTVTVQSKFNHQHEPELELFDTLSFEPIQLHQKYILTQIKSGLILIDQHAAHVRVLFEKYIHSMAGKVMPTQQSLFPKTINLSANDAQILNEILKDVQAFGFDIQSFGENAFVIHGLPADLLNVDEQNVIEKLLEQYKLNQSELNIDKRTSLAQCLAQQTAVQTGQILEKKEMKKLIDELFGCEVPYLSPNGALTFITIGLDELEQQFKNKPA